MSVQTNKLSPKQHLLIIRLLSVGILAAHFVTGFAHYDWNVVLLNLEYGFIALASFWITYSMASNLKYNILFPIAFLVHGLVFNPIVVMNIIIPMIKEPVDIVLSGFLSYLLLVIATGFYRLFSGKATIENAPREVGA